MAIKEGIPFIPCSVIPHYLQPNGSLKNLDIDVANWVQESDSFGKFQIDSCANCVQLKNSF